MPAAPTFVPGQMRRETQYLNIHSNVMIELTNGDRAEENAGISCAIRRCIGKHGKTHNSGSNAADHKAGVVLGSAGPKAKQDGNHGRDEEGRCCIQLGLSA
jgi:hypothetical protein